MHCVFEITFTCCHFSDGIGWLAKQIALYSSLRNQCFCFHVMNINKLYVTTTFKFFYKNNKTWWMLWNITVFFHVKINFNAQLYFKLYIYIYIYVFVCLLFSSFHGQFFYDAVKTIVIDCCILCEKKKFTCITSLSPQYVTISEIERMPTSTGLQFDFSLFQSTCVS